MIGFLLLFAIVLTTGTYAFWASKVNVPEVGNTTEEVIVGGGNDVTTSFVLTNNTTTGGALVPATQLNNSLPGSVDKVRLSYDVKWTEDGQTSQLAGTRSTTDIIITSEITITDEKGKDVTKSVNYLIHVTPDLDNPTTLTLDASLETFNFDITMNEPKNQDEYNAIVNGTITITFTFSLSTINTVDLE